MGSSYSDSFDGMSTYMRHCYCTYLSVHLQTPLQQTVLHRYNWEYLAQLHHSIVFSPRVFLKPGLWTSENHSVNSGVLKSKYSMDKHLTKENRNQWIRAFFFYLSSRQFWDHQADGDQLDNSSVSWFFLLSLFLLFTGDHVVKLAPVPTTLLKGAHGEE